MAFVEQIFALVMGGEIGEGVDEGGDNNLENNPPAPLNNHLPAPMASVEQNSALVQEGGDIDQVEGDNNLENNLENNPNNIPNHIMASEEHNSQAEDFQAEACPICLEDFEHGGVAIICAQPHHRVCHGCFPRLYANHNNWMGGGLCPECRAPLLPLNPQHPYMETLPAETRDYIENHVPPPPVVEVEERPRQRQRRNGAQFSRDIAAIADEGERNFAAAKREYHRLRNGPGGRACRATRLKRQLGDAHPDYIVARHHTRTWRENNPPPRRGQFTN